MGKYEEALERARQGKPIDEVFPELKESEDERIRKEMIHWLKGFIGEEEGCGYTDGEIRERIAYLEKQKEQKLAEWSEEDDQLIGFIFDLLNSLVWRKGWAMSKEECLERLKSLRPHWKPSEEQMEAPQRAVNKLAKTDVADSVRLSIMYDNIKKQM